VNDVWEQLVGECKTTMTGEIQQSQLPFQWRRNVR
jgi:hypothetical protein